MGVGASAPTHGRRPSAASLMPHPSNRSVDEGKWAELVRRLFDRGDRLVIRVGHHLPAFVAIQHIDAGVVWTARKRESRQRENGLTVDEVPRIPSWCKVTDL